MRVDPEVPPKVLLQQAKRTGKRGRAGRLDVVQSVEDSAEFSRTQARIELPLLATMISDDRCDLYRRTPRIHLARDIHLA